MSPARLFRRVLFLALTAALSSQGAWGQAAPAPHGASDILRILEQSRPDPAAVEKAQLEARKQPPRSDDRKELGEFYAHRAEAADRIGASAQNIADLREALKYYDERDPAALLIMLELATFESVGGNFLSAMQLLENVTRNTPRNALGFAFGAQQQMTTLAS